MTSARRSLSFKLLSEVHQSLVSSDLLTYGSAKSSGFGLDQGTWAMAVAVPRSTGEPGKASPIRGGGRTANRSQARAWEDCRRLIEHLTEGLGGVRSMGELSGATVICSSLSQTRMSPAVANNSCSRVRPSCSTRA